MSHKSDDYVAPPTRTIHTREQLFFLPCERLTAEGEARRRGDSCYVVVDSRSEVPRPLMLVVGNRKVAAITACEALQKAGLWKRMWILVLSVHVSSESWAKVKGA